MKPQRILIMGLPGSGKTYFAERLQKQLQQHGKRVGWLNADDVRKLHNDWDFSDEGRTRQSERMRRLADAAADVVDVMICDFVAPTQQIRNIFDAHWVVWVDTLDESRFADTNKIFVPPSHYDFRITEQNADLWVPYVATRIIADQRRPQFNWKKETVQMLGRWQPWHQGHRALFERALAKTGQVCIMVRHCEGWQDSNPFSIDRVVNNIRRDLDPLYQGMYDVIAVPNIVHITYGRKVGYTIEQEHFDEETESISGTKIREQMSLK